MNGTTPGKIQEDYDTALLEVTAEFGRCVGVYDEDLLDKIRELFAKTIGKAIKESGVAWEEPIRSYALRHVCKIGHKAGCSDDCEGPSEDDLQDAFDKVIKKAQATCTVIANKPAVKATKIGILCQGV
jgi:hypothetical protein